MTFNVAKLPTTYMDDLSYLNALLDDFFLAELCTA